MSISPEINARMRRFFDRLLDRLGPACGAVEIDLKLFGDGTEVALLGDTDEDDLVLTVADFRQWLRENSLAARLGWLDDRQSEKVSSWNRKSPAGFDTGEA